MGVRLVGQTTVAHYYYYYYFILIFTFIIQVFFFLKYFEKMNFDSPLLSLVQPRSNQAYKPTYMILSKRTLKEDLDLVYS